MQLIGDGLRDAFDPYSRAAGEVADEESKKDEDEKTAAAANATAAGSDHE
jgi:peptide/nickel transport system permease protein